MKLISILKLAISNPCSFAAKIYGKVRRNYLMHVKKDPFYVDVARWFKDDGDVTLRLEYPSLDTNSIVFDLGGYIGDYAQEINEKYGCTVYLFEPHPDFFKKCVERFKCNKKIIPLNFGIADVNGEFELIDSATGSSFLNTRIEGKPSIRCRVREFFEVIEELNIPHIHLMKINIEGGEYPLLEHIANNNKIGLVDNYQIQFHNFIDAAAKRRDGIVKALGHTHKRTWCYEFVWENWELK